MYRKPKVTKEDLGVNPFSVPLKIPAVKYTEKNKSRFEEGLVLPSDVIYDKDEKTSVFIGRSRRLLISGLSNPAQRLFLWLIQEITTGQDYITVNIQRYMEENGIKSMATYTAGRKDLQKSGIICSTTVPTVFWINPDVFFNGSRVKAFPDNISLDYDYSALQ